MAVLLLAGCGDDDDGGGAATTTTAAADTSDSDDTGSDVTISNFEFDPPILEVTAGSTVRWTNDDGVTHTVTAGSPGTASGDFDGSLDAGASAQITLDETGTIDYFCAIHPTMTGQVVVS